MIHSQQCASFSNVLKETLDKSMTQKDSLSKIYLKIPIMKPVSGVFISVPGVRTPVPRVNTPATVVGTAVTPATATPAAGLTSHQGSESGKSVDFPQVNDQYCRRNGMPRATYAARYSSNGLKCCQSVARGLCSWQKKGSPMRDFTKVNSLL